MTDATILTYQEVKDSKPLINCYTTPQNLHTVDNIKAQKYPRTAFKKSRQ
jgi:hypothetical protein